MTLPDQLIGYYSSTLIYDPEVLRFGATDQEVHLHERKLNRRLLQGKVRLLQLQNSYAQSYLSTNSPKLIHIRDLLISLALTWLSRSVQFKDSAGTTLTSHAKLFWASDYAHEFIQDNDAVSINQASNPQLISTVGSLAYEVLIRHELNDLSYPIDLLNKILRWFWEDQGLSFLDPPAQRHEQILNKLVKPVLPFSALSFALNKITETDLNNQPIESRSVVPYIRQQLLSLADWDNLRQRFLLSEYSPALLTALKQLQLAANTSDSYRTYTGLTVQDVNNIDRLASNLIKIVPPTGFLLIYTAYAVEGLFRAARRLNNVSEELAVTDFSLFIKTKSEIELKKELARDLALAYDAFAALAYFGSIQEAKGLSYRCFLLASQVIESVGEEIEAEGDTRLYKFVAT